MNVTFTSSAADIVEVGNSVSTVNFDGLGKYDTLQKGEYIQIGEEPFYIKRVTPARFGFEVGFSYKGTIHLRKMFAPELWAKHCSNIRRKLNKAWRRN